MEDALALEGLEIVRPPSCPEDEIEVKGWAPGLGDPEWIRKYRSMVAWT